MINDDHSVPGSATGQLVGWSSTGKRVSSAVSKALDATTPKTLPADAMPWKLTRTVARNGKKVKKGDDVWGVKRKTRSEKENTNAKKNCAARNAVLVILFCMPTNSAIARSANMRWLLGKHTGDGLITKAKKS